MPLRPRHTLVPIAALLALPGRGAAAQDSPLATPTPVVVAREGTHAGRIVGGSLLGGAAGVLLGGVAGAFVGGNRCEDEGNPDSCHGLDGMLLGSAVGFSFGVPVGAHVANRGAGSLGWSLIASAATAAAGAAVLKIADQRPPGAARGILVGTVAISVPVLQVVSATLIQSRTGLR